MYPHSSLLPNWEFMRNKERKMKKIITICIIGFFALNVQAQPVRTLKLSDKELLDKIKGGWAGQTLSLIHI